MLILESLLTTYWSQVVLILAAMSFLITRSMNLRDKKIELKHSLIQQQKILAINSFIQSYAAAQQLWIQIPYYDALDNKISATAMDNTIVPIQNALYSSLYSLMIVLNAEEFKKFEAIVDSIEEVRKLMGDLRYLYAKRDLNTKANEYYTKISHVTSINKGRLMEIGKHFQAEFGG